MFSRLTSSTLTIIYLSCWFNFSQDLCFVMMTIIGWNKFFFLVRSFVVNKCSLIITLFFVIISRNPIRFSNIHTYEWHNGKISRHLLVAPFFSCEMCSTCVAVLILSQRKIQHWHNNKRERKKGKTCKDDKINTHSNDVMLLLTTFSFVGSAAFYPKTPTPSAQWRFGLLRGNTFRLRK